MGDSRLVGRLALGRKTIAARGLRIAAALKKKTRKDILHSLATSVLFDEASNVTMSSLLNVFCNAMLHTGEVRVVTLTLEELADGRSSTIFEALCKVTIIYLLNILWQLVKSVIKLL